MKLAYLIPTHNPPLATACFAAWRAMGWDTFALVNGEHYSADIPGATGILRLETYAGWGESFNALVRTFGAGYDWLATGGDDCLTPPVPAETIGRELSAHFGGTMGVCQATGDAWAWNKNGTVESICFAPIIGTEFCRRWNGGRGALWPDYVQWWSDRELYEVTHRARLLLERPDWFLEHRHVAKTGGISPPYKMSKHHLWAADAELFRTRQAAGFPGHEPSDAC